LPKFTYSSSWASKNNNLRAVNANNIGVSEIGLIENILNQECSQHGKNILEKKSSSSKTEQL
jgi:hypothetical protein